MSFLYRLFGTRTAQPAQAVAPSVPVWPDETRDQAALREFYGPPGTSDWSFRPPMVKVPLSSPMRLAWDLDATRSFLWCHELAAPSLVRVLAKIDAAYSEAQKRDLGIDLFGGDYAPRMMTGANRASLHSWGIAYDFDPVRNALKSTKDTARLGQPDAVPFWEAWESEGWCSLGRSKNFDWMHVQAARRAY